VLCKPFSIKALKGIGVEYCVIDCTNALVYGPHQTLSEACAQADALTVWEIINGNGDLIDWSRESAQRNWSVKTGTHGQLAQKGPK
jgi:hypothetical protein